MREVPPVRRLATFTRRHPDRGANGMNGPAVPFLSCQWSHPAGFPGRARNGVPVKLPATGLERALHVMGKSGVLLRGHAPHLPQPGFRPVFAGVRPAVSVDGPSIASGSTGPSPDNPGVHRGNRNPGTDAMSAPVRQPSAISRRDFHPSSAGAARHVLPPGDLPIVPPEGMGPDRDPRGSGATRKA